MGVRDISGAKAVMLIMSNVMNMLTLVLLMAYGLFNIPVFLWKYADNQHHLYLELERAEAVRRDYRAAMADFYLVVSQCKNLINHHKTPANTQFLEILD